MLYNKTNSSAAPRSSPVTVTELIQFLVIMSIMSAMTTEKDFINSKWLIRLTLPLFVNAATIS